MPMDDSEFLDPWSPRHFKHIQICILAKASLLLFDILPQVFLSLCNAWISLLMWFNHMG